MTAERVTLEGRVRVPVRAGRRKLVLPVRLLSGRFTARRTLEIARS